MDMDYNILKLEEYLRKTIQNCLTSKKDIKYIIRDWLDEKEPYLLNEKELGELKKYSSSSIRLTLEKMILVSLESKAYKESHWQALKERGEKSRSFMLSHYFDSLIDDIKKNISSYDKNNNIEEIEKFYNEQIKDSFQIFGDSINHVIENTRSISLNHMNNLNANGRTISLKDSNDSLKRIGGIFLSKESKIGYANFVNKKDLLKNFKTSANQKEIRLKNGTIQIYDFKRIVNSLTQTLTIKSNSNIKNQDARLIMENDKKVGSIFLGKNGIDLENGTYISVEELSFALNQYLKEKNSMNEQPKKVIKRKGKIKQAVASVALATSLLSTVTLPTGEAKEDTTIISEQKLEGNKEYSSTNKITLNSLELKQAIPNDHVEISKLYEDSNDSSIAEVFQQSSLENINVEKQEEPQIGKEEITETTNEILEEKPDKQLDEVVEEEQTEVLNEVIEEKEEQAHIEESIELEEEKEDLDSEIKEEQTEILNEIVEDKEKQTEDLNKFVEDKEVLEKETSNEKAEDIIEETNKQNDTKEELSLTEKEEALEESKKADTSLNEPISSSTIQEDNLENTINGQDIVDYAVQFVGNPYEYGGDSLTEGTDCSGFTKGVYSHFGIELPRTSKEQRSIGTSVGKNLENALPGDLICYNGHVAIYVGDGQIVHASTEKTGIKIGKADYQDVVTIQRIVEPQIEKEESKVK